MTRSLVSNVSVLTAIANDMGYEQTFRFQLEMGLASKDDVLILISSSGNSPNIIEAAKYAIEHEMILIGMSGFDGGRLKEMATISLHVPVSNYGVVEDCHQALMHCLAQVHYLQVRQKAP